MTSTDTLRERIARQLFDWAATDGVEWNYATRRFFESRANELLSLLQPLPVAERQGEPAAWLVECVEPMVTCEVELCEERPERRFCAACGATLGEPVIGTDPSRTMRVVPLYRAGAVAGQPDERAVFVDDCGCRTLMFDEHHGGLQACEKHEAEFKEREKGPFMPAKEVFAKLREQLAAAGSGDAGREVK